MQWTDRIGQRLKLRDLHILLSVVQRGSMAKAAAGLAISQPAVSKAIADMEHAVGLRLLDRSRNGIEPTAYGQALIKRGLVIFDELKQGVAELEFLADPTAGELRIGSTEGIAAGLLPAIIERFSREYPRVHLDVAQAVITTLNFANCGSAALICSLDASHRISPSTICRRMSCTTIRSSWWLPAKANGRAPVALGLPI